MSERFDKDGYLLKRAGSTKKKATPQKKYKWTAYYFNLIDGALYYYKNPEDPEPHRTVLLKDFTLVKEPQDGGRQFVFGLKNDKQDLILATEEEGEMKDWVNAIEANKSKGVAPPLKKEKRRTRAQELAHKAKKNMIGKAATTKLGKKTIRATAPEEVTNLIVALKNIVEKESKNSKKANDVEDTIYKIGIKAFFLLECNKLTIDKLLVADKPLRASLNLLGKCHDHAKYSRNPNEKLMMEKLGEVEKLLQEAAHLLMNVLEPHIKPKNLNRIKEMVDYLGNAEMLFAIFLDPALEGDLQELIGASEHYTQFHFYAEDK